MSRSHPLSRHKHDLVPLNPKPLIRIHLLLQSNPQTSAMQTPTHHQRKPTISPSLKPNANTTQTTIPLITQHPQTSPLSSTPPIHPSKHPFYHRHGLLLLQTLPKSKNPPLRLPNQLWRTSRTNTRTAKTQKQETETNSADADRAF